MDNPALEPAPAGMGLTPNQADCMRVIQELMDQSGSARRTRSWPTSWTFAPRARSIGSSPV